MRFSQKDDYCSRNYQYFITAESFAILGQLCYSQNGEEYSRIFPSRIYFEELGEADLLLHKK